MGIRGGSQMIGIQFAVVGLSYFMLVVITYGITIFLNMDEGKSEEIINKSYQYAYIILASGLLIVYFLLIVPHITFDHEVASYLILGCKLLSLFTLAGSLYVLSKK
jgi:ABC-type Na+ efflux pump permease subunit